MASNANRAAGAVLAIDIGSSSVRAMAFDRRANAIEGLSSQIAYDLDTTADGGVTLDPGELLRLVVMCVDTVIQAAQSGVRFEAVGFSCFWHSLVGLDRSGDTVTPIYHLADNRSADVVDDLRRDFDEQQWKAIGGTVFHSSYWPAKLVWLKRTDPATFARVAQWTSAADVVLSHLTGSRSTSVCMASGTGMLDISRCAWSPEIAGLAGIDLGSLPLLVDRHEASSLNADYARRWPSLAEAPWFQPLGDGACANVGCGAVDPNQMAMTLGTTGAVRVLQASPAGEKVESVDGLWVYRLDRQSVIRGAAITNGGIWAEFLIELLGEDDALFDEAFALAPAKHGLTILPFLAGERAPIWNDRARAVIAGLHPQTTRAEILRAGLESVAHRMRLIYGQMEPVMASEHVIVANGAALLKSSGWQQMVASALDHPITTLSPELEASARGAAICALESAGILDHIGDVDDLTEEGTIVEPDSGEAAVYRIERERQERLLSLLYPHGSSWDLD